MKNSTSSLMPLAAFALFGACLTSVFSLLVVLMTSFGFAGALPLLYFQKLNIAVISVALPMVGMILFALITLRLPRKPETAVQSTVNETAINLPMSNKEKEEEYLAKAA